MRWTLDKYRELDLRAKSETYGPVLLEDHLLHVSSASEKIAQAFGKDISLCRNGAYLHDIGKAHPKYQGFVHEFLNVVDLGSGIPHRHELSSLAFLPLFPKEQWPPLTEMIVAHHKSITSDSSERGLLDIVNRHGVQRLLHSHLKDWKVWSPRALKILENLQIQTRQLRLSEADDALRWAVEYCRELGDGWSDWKGLLMGSDHMASALDEDLEAHLEPLFNKPEFTNTHDPHLLYPLSMKSIKDQRSHTLVVAPTGAGKTDFLLNRCKGRIFYLLPFQASINAMYQRIKKMVPDETDVRLLHAASRLVADDEPRQEVQLQPFVGANIKVLTPHQISNIIFGSMGFEANLLDLQGCDVILDEVHTYEAESQAMVVEIVKVLLQQDCRIHIGTATMPTALYTKLFDLMGGKEQVYEVNLTKQELATYDRHMIYKHQEFEELYETIEQALLEKEKILIVLNTVKGSQEVYDQLASLFPEIPSMLLHSRFRRKDRRDREMRLEEEFDAREGPCFVVSTQVVEVSLDINFNRMITQAAPLDALIQRFGRVNRERLPEEERNLKPIHVIAPGESTLPYSKENIEKSYNLLPEGKLKATEVQELIDEVYPEIIISEISGHCRWEEGKLELEKLRHISKSVLLELLQIDSTTCILEQDLDEYEDADWQEKQWLEIPINQKSLYRIESKLGKAQTGSEPYIMPRQDKYNKLGLEIKEPSNFI